MRKKGGEGEEGIEDTLLPCKVEATVK